MNMQAHHWLLIVIVFVVGYVFARYYPSLGQKIGLP